MINKLHIKFLNVLFQLAMLENNKLTIDKILNLLQSKCGSEKEIISITISDLEVILKMYELVVKVDLLEDLQFKGFDLTDFLEENKANLKSLIKRGYCESLGSL